MDYSRPTSNFSYQCYLVGVIMCHHTVNDSHHLCVLLMCSTTHSTRLPIYAIKQNTEAPPMFWFLRDPGIASWIDVWLKHTYFALFKQGMLLLTFQTQMGMTHFQQTGSQQLVVVKHPTISNTLMWAESLPLPLGQWWMGRVLTSEVTHETLLFKQSGAHLHSHASLVFVSPDLRHIGSRSQLNYWHICATCKVAKDLEYSNQWVYIQCILLWA